MSDDVFEIAGYTIKPEPIAEGGSSVVWEAVDAGGNSFALKLLTANAKADPEQVNVLKHEAKVSKLFEHPNFVQFYELINTKQYSGMILELFRAPSAKSTLRNNPHDLHLRFGTFVEQLCQSLAHMHEKGWVHRDLKPDNVLFNKGGELRLIDFSLSMKAASGFAKLIGSKTKSIQGTRTYIAPETIRKAAPTPKTDMYSLGITLYEVLTQVTPFRCGNPKELLLKHLNEKPVEPSAYNEHLTPEIDEFILRLISKKPEHRPADMLEVMTAFRSIAVFKEDINEIIAREKEGGGQQALAEEMDDRLNSRADAARTAAGIVRPVVPRKKPVRQPDPKEQQPTPPPQQMPPQPMAPQPAMGYPGMMPPPGMPQYPGMPPQGGQPYPGMMPPQGMPYPMPPGQGQPPQQMPPGWSPAAGLPPLPGAYPQQPGQAPLPGQPVQGQPGQPPQQMPPQGVPMPPGLPGGAPVEAPRPSVDPQVPPAHPGMLENQAHPSQSDNDEDLPFMDELPDVL